MESQMIYIIEDNIPLNQLPEKFAQTVPLTKEQVVELIISKINGSDEANFLAFTKYCERLTSEYSTEEEKKDALMKYLKELERNNRDKGTWNDPKQLKSDLFNELISFHYEYGKTILYNSQIEYWINRAADLMILCKKKEYLELSLAFGAHSFSKPDNLVDIIQKQVEETVKSVLQTTNIPGQKLVKKEKKIPEKWYALLHMIYVKMGKFDKFENLSDKKEIIRRGKENHPFKGTGQLFYYEIQRIDNYGIYKYIQTQLKKDYRKWKRIIIEISNNDPEVIEYIAKNKL